MAFNYVPLANTAQRLVTRFGRSVSFVRANETLTDPNKPHQGNLTPYNPPAETVVIDACFVPVGDTAQLGLEFTEPAFLDKGEQLVIIGPGPTNTVDFFTFDAILDGTTHWKIKASEELKPGPQSMIYFFMVGR